MNNNYYTFLFCIFSLCLSGASSAASHDLKISSEIPISGNINMPLVSPDEAAKYLDKRVVPKSDQLTINPKALSQPPIKVNAKTTLGHELPVDRKTPSGFTRADFAIADQEAASENLKQDNEALGTKSIIKKVTEVSPTTSEKSQATVGTK